MQAICYLVPNSPLQLNGSPRPETIALPYNGRWCCHIACQFVKASIGWKDCRLLTASYGTTDTSITTWHMRSFIARNFHSLPWAPAFALTLTSLKQMYLRAKPPLHRSIRSPFRRAVYRVSSVVSLRYRSYRVNSLHAYCHPSLCSSLQTSNISVKRTVRASPTVKR